MLYANSRRDEILKMIQLNKSMNVNDLLKKFDASPATIRKDLTFLENEGHIKRSRGEVSIKSQSSVQPFGFRSGQQQREKELIATQAVSLIHNGDSIILDSGTTSFEIAKLLDRFDNITVITYSLPISNYLAQTNANVIMPGGILHKQTMSLIGPETERFFEQVEANIMFVSASGIRQSEGLTISLPFECPVKTNAIHAAKTVCATIDSSKFDRVCINMFATFSDLDIFITDQQPPADLQHALDQNGVKTIYPSEQNKEV